MENQIIILHLSDIHFKRKENETYREDVQGKMIDTIKKHLEKYHMGLSFVAVTGDIAFSGKEYDEAKAFFKNLRSVLPSKTKFLVVPGNHDVDRRKISKFFSLHKIVQNKKTDAFLEDIDEIGRQINPKFKAFCEFTGTLKPKLYKNEEDYCWVKDFKDENVSFLGLNSCWACENDKDKDNITLGYPQVMNALKKSKISNKIVLIHHPLNWLNEIDFNRYSGEIFHHCQLILHGHTHADNALVFKTPADSCICLGANASYTDDKEDGFIGFQFIEVEFRKNGVGVKVWPYRSDKRGRFRFVQDFYRWEDQDGPFFELKTYKDEDDTKKKETRKTPLLSLEIPKEYKDWVRQFHSTMDIDLLAGKGEVITVSLPEVYIPIETRNPFNYMIEHKPINIEIASKSGSTADVEGPSSINIETLVRRKKRILLQGGAGMGKTTLVKHLAYDISHEICHPSLKGYLPVMVFLKDIWPIYQEELKKNHKKLMFEELLSLYLGKEKCQLTWETVSHYLELQKALFLIDGLDEMPQNLRKDLVGVIAKFQFQYSQNRFLLTGRPHGITGEAIAKFGDDLHDIEPLNDGKIKDFIKKWFKAVSKCATGLGESTADGMISDIHQHEHISAFTQNPLLLTAVCILYQDGKRIPEQRADLYNRIIGNLIYRRFHDPAHPGKENEILEFLMALAFETQKKNHKTIEIDETLEILRNIFPKILEERQSHYKQRILVLFDEVESGCGLFNHLISGEIEFNHLTFQEFLAAKHMMYMDIEWQQFLEKEWWEEPLLLYTGLINIDRKRASNNIVKRILEDKAKNETDIKKCHRLKLLGSQILCDFQPTKRDKTLVSFARDRLYELIESEAGLEERFKAGALVGELGDIRIRPDNMVLIQAGEFTMGTDEISYQSKPECRIFLDAFMIGIYPVTNQEFKRFVDDMGYQRKEFWMSVSWQWRCDENINEPAFWYDRKYNGPNFPVVGISWYEATAYANWLSKLTGKPCRLPNEAEWEKASRGTDGRTYPWGNELGKNLCNSDESGLNSTSPVGIFPKGKSPYGCFDMAGNVWEWCCYEEKYSKTSKEYFNDSLGIHRGGSWKHPANTCASPLRAVFSPRKRLDNLGMRLASSL